MPDFYLALLAAVEHVRGGDLHEAEVQHEEQVDDRVTTLTVTVRRYEVAVMPTEGD